MAQPRLGVLASEAGTGGGTACGAGRTRSGARRSPSCAVRRAQLMRLLKKVSPTTEVRQPDVEYLLESCDKDGDGNISRDEVIAACATWKATVERHEHEAAKDGGPDGGSMGARLARVGAAATSSMCTLL